ETLASLGRSGILDDRRLALTRAEALAERGYGNAAIRARLEQAGLTGDLVEEALDRLEPEHPRAQRILDRRGVSPKTFRLLVSRGFGVDTLESVEPVADTG